jgi:hypothetical protein
VTVSEVVEDRTSASNKIRTEGIEFVTINDLRVHPWVHVTGVASSGLVEEFVGGTLPSDSNSATSRDSEMILGRPIGRVLAGHLPKRRVRQ